MHKFVDTSKKNAQKTFDENISKSLIEFFKQGKHKLICCFYYFIKSRIYFYKFFNSIKSQVQINF